ncbi:MAG TPA: helix-turn-helix transcriptional regulator [Candidatus Scybalocola faecavium]|nr:helix-turn-helix transcriptional regulator [Candidatus Scybalocola faecavium]
MKNKIRQLRKSRGMRQEDLARFLGVTRQTINAIENDKYNPTLELAMRLAKFLNTTVEELFILDD